jgi:hypothetical protein
MLPPSALYIDTASNVIFAVNLIAYFVYPRKHLCPYGKIDLDTFVPLVGRHIGGDPPLLFF